MNCWWEYVALWYLLAEFQWSLAGGDKLQFPVSETDFHIHVKEVNPECSLFIIPQLLSDLCFHWADWICLTSSVCACLDSSARPNNQPQLHSSRKTQWRGGWKEERTIDMVISVSDTHTHIHTHITVWQLENNQFHFPLHKPFIMKRAWNCSLETKRSRCIQANSCKMKLSLSDEGWLYNYYYITTITIWHFLSLSKVFFTPNKSSRKRTSIPWDWCLYELVLIVLYNVFLRGSNFVFWHLRRSVLEQPFKMIFYLVLIPKWSWHANKVVSCQLPTCVVRIYGNVLDIIPNIFSEILRKKKKNHPFPERESQMWDKANIHLQVLTVWSSTQPFFSSFCTNIGILEQPLHCC